MDTALGADEQALLLNLAMEKAKHTGRQLVGLALAWSKVYDLVDMGRLWRLLNRVGLPAGLTAPLLKMYEAGRRICLDGALGNRGRPLSGIARLPAGDVHHGARSVGHLH